MKLSKFIALIGLVVTSAFALCQENTAPTVVVKAPATAKHGAQLKLTVQITFASGLHGYQNPPSDPNLIPVVVGVDTKGIVVKKVTYPAGKDASVGGDPKPVKVYEGTISVPVTIVVPKKKGKIKVTIDVSYQQCNAESCFPPSDVKATVPLTVK